MRVDRLRVGWLRYHESRRCSRDTYPESYVTKYTSIRRLGFRFKDLGARDLPRGGPVSDPEREFFNDNLLVRIHFIIVMIRWTGLAPWEFEFPFPGSLTSTFRGSSAIHARPFEPQTQVNFSRFGQSLAIPAHKMAARPHQWLKDRTWDNPRP